MNELARHLIRRRQAALRGIDLRGPRSSHIRLRHGVYLPRAIFDQATRAQRYECFVRATVDTLKVPAPLANESAAALLGIPIIGRWPTVVHVVEAPTGGGRTSTNVIRHGSRALPETVLVDGIAVSSVARTVIDLARVRTFVSGLASADFALRRGLTTREELEEELDRLGGARGVVAARAVVEHADGRAESVGESLSRGQMILLGLPAPHLQQEFEDDGVVDRCDFWWPERSLIGEFDGYVKFGRDLAATEADARAALWAEKQREDRLRRPGLRMIRWTWDQALRLEKFARFMGSAGFTVAW